VCNRPETEGYIPKTMALLAKHFEKVGNWLFRWRSYLPFVFAPIVLLALRNFAFPYGSHRLDQLWEVFCLIIALSGLAIRIFTVAYVPEGTSGRNSKIQKARALNTTGMYSLVRHPLYLGNFLIWSGVSLFARLWWLSVILLLGFWLYYERIIFAEEEFLRHKFGREFINWAEQTPAFLPRLSSWKKPALPFSIRMVLRREHPTLFLIIVSFAAMEEAASLVTAASLEWDLMWVILFTVGLAQYTFFRMLKKHTNVLNTFR
jgi:protein-S-isoprenylcysteine O-methyltransferase Ste14